MIHNIIVTHIACSRQQFWLILINRNSIIPKTREKLTGKYSYLPSFAYHIQFSSLCRTAQTPTYVFRHYRWPLFLIPHSPFPIPHSPFLVLVTSVTIGYFKFTWVDKIYFMRNSRVNGLSNCCVSVRFLKRTKLTKTVDLC